VDGYVIMCKDSINGDCVILGDRYTYLNNIVLLIAVLIILLTISGVHKNTNAAGEFWTSDVYKSNEV